MRVLFIGPLPEPVTGQSLACRVFLDELQKHHEVDVVNLSKDGFRQGVSSFGRVLDVFRIVVDIWRKQRGADLIYLTVAESPAGNLRDLAIYLVCSSSLSRMLIHLHGGASLRLLMLGHRGPRRLVNERLVSRLGGAIVLGERHTEIFANVLPPHRIHQVPNFAEDSMFIEADGVTAKFAKMNPLRVLFLSNLLPGKGYVELVAGYRELPPPQRNRVRIDFAGGFESAAHEEAFRGSITDLPHVHYHGTVRGDAKRQLFHQAHVFCLPTYYPYEGQPISILEAYASGCAVVTTDHSGIGDIFTAGVNGYQVASRSASTVRTALLEALGDPERLRTMAETNLTTARSAYRTTIFNQNLLRIATSVAGG